MPQASPLPCLGQSPSAPRNPRYRDRSFRRLDRFNLSLMRKSRSRACDAPQPAQVIIQPGMDVDVPPRSNAGSGLEAESLPGELAEDISQATDAISLGPTPVSTVRFLMDGLGLGNWLDGPGIRTFGWVEGRLHRRIHGLTACSRSSLGRIDSATSFC